MYDIPILMNVFRRPEQTQKVIEAVARVKPKRLYVAADGPRPHVEGEHKKCQQVVDLFNKLTWNCEVKMLCQDSNIGSRANESGGMSWFFANEPYGIILEDDCLPHLDFFHYCRELLLRYRNEKQVMHIAGTQVIPGYQSEASYFFSHIPLAWGWATWADRWGLYDEAMSDYPSFRDNNGLGKIIKDQNYQRLWRNIFNDVYERKVDAWDFIWIYYIMKNSGLCINPKKNLISNIGFGANSTYCTDENHKHAALQMFSIGELIHPKKLQINKKAEALIYELIWDTLPYSLKRSSAASLTDILCRIKNKFVNHGFSGVVQAIRRRLGIFS